MSAKLIAAVLGCHPADPIPMHRPRSIAQRVLGETSGPPVEEPSPASPPKPDKEEEHGDTHAVADANADVNTDDGLPINSDVGSLVHAWESGSKMDVAQRVYGGLNSYTDLVSFIHGIGPEGGQELGRLLDEIANSEVGNDEIPPDSVEAPGEGGAAGGDDADAPAFGIYKDRPVDSSEHQRSLRAEWNRR